MTHLHLPDGVLPLWVPIVAWVLAIVWVFGAAKIASSRPDALKKLPLLAVISAFMLVVMSIEIVPIAYHINLSALAGMLLGPILAPIAAFIVEVFLSLMGHGGISVMGVNLLLLSAEMSLGWLVFAGLRRLLKSKRVGLAAGVATVVALAISTSLMLLVVSTVPGAIPGHEGELMSLRNFTILVFSLGPIGWVLESFITGTVVNYLAKARPSLFGIKPKESDDAKEERS